jgi:hypothetical protein
MRANTKSIVIMLVVLSWAFQLFGWKTPQKGKAIFTETGRLAPTFSENSNAIQGYWIEEPPIPVVRRNGAVTAYNGYL